jgi:uncharacterized protein (DUF2252 family)
MVQQGADRQNAKDPVAHTMPASWSATTAPASASGSALPNIPSLGERVAAGKAARLQAPRTAHAVFAPAADRRDPVELLEEQAAERVPELVPIRYGRMLVSPFTFYRGGASIMAADLASLGRTGLHSQLCGDAHLSNFGIFAAPDRRLVFSVNDFDEALPGPFEWDLKRLSASFAVAGRERGFDRRTRRRINRTAPASYRDAMRRLASMRVLDRWYTRFDVEEILAICREQAATKSMRLFEKNVAKARAKDNLRAFTKLTHVVDGRPRIVSDPPLIVPIEELAGEAGDHAIERFARGLIRQYPRTLSGDRRRLLRRFRYVHAARRAVGVGSVGTRSWVVLLLGRDDDDPLFLQLKEATASVLERFLPRSRYANHGQRVVEAQKLMQAASDIMLGWERTEDIEGVPRSFYVRQLWDQKGSAVIETMDPRSMTIYAQMCGKELARAHARSGDPVAIASYLGASDVVERSLADFAELYADQNESDFAALQQAVRTGRVAAQTGV